MKINFLIIGSCLLCLLCGEAVAGGKVKYSKITDVPQVKWLELTKKKIYFGHQSVGFNIVSGMEDIIKDYPKIQLNIIQSRKIFGHKGVFIHSRVGENRKPMVKIADFINVIDGELGIVPDAAALKFCFVDVSDKTDVSVFFKQYQKAMSDLKKEHPKITIIHFTIPLRTQEVNWKTKVKLLAGREVWEFSDNVKRNVFNQLILATYDGREPVFDIAKFEATTPRGELTSFKYNGNQYLSMNPSYSGDGGHLNRIGRKVIAEKFLLFLVNELL